jgi:acyl-CoA synthetase (AMP-forming)/AMP-acid ligase II
MAQLIVAHPRFSEADLSSIVICAIGSAPLAPATLRALQERMPEASVSNSYGMTEAGPAFCSMPKGESLKRIGSVGQPVPPLEVRIVDDDGHDMAPGEVGEAILRMPGREREYYRNDDATAGTWKDGWLYSGDLARLDEDGFLYIVGRKKDVIIRGGNNIHAMDVEAVLIEHPHVVEAAVVGVPHAVLGEDVAAVVVLAPGAATTPDELREYCAAALADYKVPRRIEVVAELPRNATGKVLKAQLRDRLTAASPR